MVTDHYKFLWMPNIQHQIKSRYRFSPQHSPKSTLYSNITVRFSLPLDAKASLEWTHIPNCNQKIWLHSLCAIHVYHIMRCPIFGALNFHFYNFFPLSHLTSSFSRFLRVGVEWRTATRSESVWCANRRQKEKNSLQFALSISAFPVISLHVKWLFCRSSSR